MGSGSPPASRRTNGRSPSRTGENSCGSDALTAIKWRGRGVAGCGGGEGRREGWQVAYEDVREVEERPEDGWVLEEERLAVEQDDPVRGNGLGGGEAVGERGGRGDGGGLVARETKEHPGELPVYVGGLKETVAVDEDEMGAEEVGLPDEQAGERGRVALEEDGLRVKPGGLQLARAAADAPCPSDPRARPSQIAAALQREPSARHPGRRTQNDLLSRDG